ncbi:hypothetical protein [Achromobacter insolitus]|uniref:hypothetical protein n=1 Tax=Achromobacter insolitus TaxID=217204 RepID=UPI0007C219BD|nr:hypothetical protein [Achromobacter insolitus]OAD12622.1 hypothetical protein A3839_20830 [Achromobacter insolitus]
MASKFPFSAVGLLLAGSIGFAAHQAKSAPLAPMIVRFTVPSLCTVGQGTDRPAVHCSQATPWHMQRAIGEQYWTVVF